MKLDLSEIAATVGKVFNYEMNEPCIQSEELICTEPITGNIVFTNAGQHIIARGSFSTVIELNCSRCLEGLVTSVNIEVDEQLPINSVRSMLLAQTEDDDKLDVEDEEPLFRDNIFDLSEYIRQQMLVEVPIKPLCNDLCKGLCPVCGTNLNEGACNCPVEVDQKPLAALAEMLENRKARDEEK